MEGNPKIPSNEYLTVRATTGFQRVRYFGWLSAAAKNKWERILALLDYKQPPLTAPTALPPPLCPCCHKPMRLVGTLARSPPR